MTFKPNKRKIINRMLYAVFPADIRKQSPYTCQSFMFNNHLVLL